MPVGKSHIVKHPSHIGLNHIVKHSSHMGGMRKPSHETPKPYRGTQRLIVMVFGEAML